MGLEPTKQYIFRAEIEKKFVRFLVQMKTLEFAFEINWPLDSCQMEEGRNKFDDINNPKKIQFLFCQKLSFKS